MKKNNSLTTFKLSELYRIHQIGQIEIEEYQGGDSPTLGLQERNFFLGKLKSRYKKRLGDEKRDGSLITQTDIDEWISMDLAIRSRLQDECAEWLKFVDQCSNFLKKFFPDFNAWDAGMWDSADIQNMIVDLGNVGAVEWDIPVPSAGTRTVLDFLFSLDDCDDDWRLVREAFGAGRFDVLLAVHKFCPTPLTPRLFWEKEIAEKLGTNKHDWFSVCHYPDVKGVNPHLDVLAQISVPPEVQRNLSHMTRHLKPDGTLEKGTFSNTNIFQKRYQTSCSSRDIAAALRGIKPEELGDKYDFRIAIEHKQFVDWHKLSAATVGEEAMRSLYEQVFGIESQTISDILNSLPPLYWIVLDFDPRQQMTQTDLKAIYRQKMKVAHPDKGGSEEEAKTVIAAYEEAKRAIGDRTSSKRAVRNSSVTSKNKRNG